MLSIVTKIGAQAIFDEKHLEVSLRMIGHQLLLKAGDSTSRVLPIIKANDQYRVEFDSALSFQPDELVRVVSKIMKETRFAARYIVEVERCDTKEVVYSFEIDNLSHQELIPCRPRAQLNLCFSLIFTILKKPPLAADESHEALTKSNLKSTLAISTSIVLLVLFGIGLIYFASRKKPVKKEGFIQLGNYQFDVHNDLLILEEQKITLTSKEAHLLTLLHSNANTVVKKETLLNEVWGDEGNYIGRTLDVFISKLRGKLQADPNIKIANIRGVGYKLVVGQ